MVIPLALFIIISDQITKFMVEDHFKAPHNYEFLQYENYPGAKEEFDAADKIPPVEMFRTKLLSFEFNHVINQGAAWGIFQGNMKPLSMVSIIVFILLFIWHEKYTEGFREREISLGLLLGGIFGNFIDRFGMFGRVGVVDFLDFDIIKYNFPSFNIADAAICIAVIIYCISSFIRPDKKKEEEKSEKDSVEEQAA